MKEKDIQQLLSKNIATLEDGLHLIDKEKYIPHSLGTRGFIDLYAKDKNNKHVLIELKKSKASSREAIHEIYKYVEGVKNKLNVRDDEIRVIVASTEWGELLVPFSRFVHDSSIEALGIQLAIDNSTTISASPINLLDYSQGRMIAPWHEIYLYDDSESLDTGIKEIKERLTRGNLEDYVLFVMKVPKSYSEHELASVASTLYEATGTMPQTLPSIPVYEFAVYVVHQLQPHTFYLEKVKSCASELELDFEEIKNDSIDENYDRFCNAIWQPSSEGHFSIGNAQKFSDIIQKYEFEILKTLRFGTFKNNELLTDKEIAREVEESSRFSAAFEKNVNLSNSSEVEHLRKSLKRSLANNQPWRTQILSILDELPKNSSIKINMCNSSSGVLAIYLFFLKYCSLEYLPSFSIEVQNNEELAYVGFLASDKKVHSLRYILNKYYDGNISNLLNLMTSDYTDDRHVDILFDLGLSYKVFKVESNKPIMVMDNSRWVKADLTSPYNSLIDYFEVNESLVMQIIKRITPYHLGAVIIPELDPLRKIREIFNLETKASSDYDLHIFKSQCDICTCPLTEEEYIIDGPLKDSSYFAMFCLDCFVTSGWRTEKASVFRKQGKSWVQLKPKSN